MNKKTAKLGNQQPICHKCRRSGAGVQFPLWPKNPNKKFGEICADCDKEQS